MGASGPALCTTWRCVESRQQRRNAGPEEPHERRQCSTQRNARSPRKPRVTAASLGRRAHPCASTVSYWRCCVSAWRAGVVPPTSQALAQHTGAANGTSAAMALMGMRPTRPPPSWWRAPGLRGRPWQPQLAG